MQEHHHRPRRRPSARRPRRLALAILASLPAGTALAATDFTLGEAKGSFKADVTLGTQFRASAVDPQLVNDANARTVGLSGNPNGTTARNNDDGDLNFRKGDRTSTVLKTLAEFQLKGETVEGVVKAKAWHDFTLGESGVSYGNIPDHYAAGAPLGENGLSRAARLSGVSLLDAYLRTHFALAGGNGDLRLGNQVLQGWGERFGLGGGLSGVTPKDLAAATRPGALAGEIPVPMPMLQAKVDGAGLGSLEGFLVLHNRHNELPACGTFFSTADFVAEGCDKVYVGAGTDLSRDAAGTYMKRADDQGGSKRGQFGLAYRWQAESLNTRFSLNYANYSSRSPVIGVVKSTDPTTPVRPGDPTGSNAQYFTEYADKVRVFGLGFESRLGATTLLGEISYRPNQPIGLNGSDILNAFASYAAASELRADATATAAGADFHGYDRFRVWQGQLAASRAMPDMLGAQELTLSGEVALRHVDGLPDASVRRYGRSTVFGLGPVAGTCAGDAIQCSSQGYVTTNAWGYRLKAALRYTGVLPGVDLMPSLGFGQDVRGWSDDGVFSQGRRIASLSLRAQIHKRYWLDAGALAAWGGTYDALRDRDYVNLSVGMSF